MRPHIVVEQLIAFENNGIFLSVELQQGIAFVTTRDPIVFNRKKKIKRKSPLFSGHHKDRREANPHSKSSSSALTA